VETLTVDGAWLALAAATIRLATPLGIAAMGELVGQRSGVLNIGIEGLMLTGAFVAFAVAVETGSPLAGMGAAMIASVAVAALFAWVVVQERADPIVTGTAVNLLALGGTGTAYRILFPPERPLVDAPVLPDVFPGLNGFVLVGLLLIAGVVVLLDRTRLGLEIRASGERAEAAHAQGVRVLRLRWGATLFCGACAGLAGATLVLWISRGFVEGMTAGRGFIALALVLFGGYRPLWIAAGAVLFGAASALQFRLQAVGVDVPYALLLMIPYVLTLVVLALYAGRARGPADLARSFDPRA
jgi:simple sugar transport system permease protein